MVADGEDVALLRTTLLDAVARARVREAYVQGREEGNAVCYEGWLGDCICFLCAFLLNHIFVTKIFANRIAVICQISLQWIKL